jgi:plasmid stabilization system protein ParE
MIVHWSETALAHLAAIHDYIARNSPRYAQRVVDRITRCTEALSRFPLMGGVVPEYRDEAIREMSQNPYRIIYRTSPERVEILAVIHGARRLPSSPPN